MTDAQTEARAIAERFPAWPTGWGAELRNRVIEEIATALAAKDAELAEVKAYSIEMLHRKDEQFERAERAEAQLAAKDAEVAKWRGRWRAKSLAFEALREQLEKEREDISFELLDAMKAQLAEANKALDAIIERSHNDPLGTSKVNDMRQIARRAREAQGGE